MTNLMTNKELRYAMRSFQKAMRYWSEFHDDLLENYELSRDDERLAMGCSAILNAVVGTLYAPANKAPEYAERIAQAMSPVVSAIIEEIEERPEDDLPVVVPAEDTVN